MTARAAMLAWREARGFRQRLFGLLGQAPPAPGHALLIPRCRAVHTCGMRYPIDIVFVDAAGCVLRCARNVPPGRALACLRARAVLEMGAGRSEATGIGIGQILPGIAEALAARPR